MATIVHLADRSPGSVYIGRGTPFGNPFHLGIDGDRQQVLSKFEAYFYDRLARDPAFWYAVRDLRGKQLYCHCKPLACHGDVIVEYLERRFGA